MLSEGEKIRIANTLFTSMTTRDFTEIEGHFSNELAFDFPGAGLISGNKRVMIFIKAMLRKYRSLSFQINEIIVIDNVAFVLWENIGETVNGNPYSNKGITHVKFQDDKIAFLSDYFKDTSFTKQE